MMGIHSRMEYGTEPFGVEIKSSGYCNIVMQLASSTQDSET
jgi:hypothetical protein